MKQQAGKGLRNIGTAAVEPLIAALKDKDCFYRVAMILEAIGDHRAVEPLIQVLKDRNFPSSRAAIEALGKLGDIRAVEPLLTLFNEEKNLRSLIATALGNIYNSICNRINLSFKLGDKFNHFIDIILYSSCMNRKIECTK